MNKSVLGIIIALVAVGGLVAFAVTNDKDEPVVPSTQTQSETQTPATSNNQDTATNTTDQTTTTESTNVAIQNFAYSPSNISVKVGTTVTWTNQDSDRHDITPDTESDDFKPSELLSKGESYSFTFAKAGIYSYHCSPHPFMKATVTVTE